MEPTSAASNVRDGACPHVWREEIRPLELAQGDALESAV